MKKKAIIFDVDGTIMPSGADGDFMPSIRFKKAIKNLQKDYVIALASGRSKKYADYLIRDIGLIDECVISAGTEIIDPATMDIIWSQLIPLHTHGHIAACLDGASAVIATQKSGHAQNDSFTLMQFMADDATALYFMGIDPEVADALEKDLLHPELTIINMHHYDDYSLRDLHIHSSKASKEHAVNELLRRREIDRKDSIVIGDGANDLHLFKAGGYKIAMGNAAPELKAEADLIIGDVKDDALAIYLEKLITENV